MINKDENFVTYRLAEYRAKPRFGSSYGSWTYLGNYLSWNGRLLNATVSTPGFDKLNRYQLPMHPHQRTEWVTLYQPMSARYDWRWPDGTWAANEYRGSPQFFGVNVGVTSGYGPSVDPINHKALARLFDNLSQTKGSAGVSMAEIGKTAELIADTTRRLATAYSALRHGRLSDFSDALGITVSKRRLAAYRGKYKQQFGSTGDGRQFAAQTWLEFTYGWKPLISDVYSQAENLANFLTERQNVVREGRGTAKETKTTIEDKLVNNVDWVVAKVTQVHFRVGYVVRYSLADGGNSIANVFGLNNPMVVAWELLPFSFVADWFLPIGKFLEQCTATAGLTFHSGVKTTKSTASSSSTVRATNVPRADQNGSLVFSISGGNAINNIYKDKTRQVLTSFPYVRLPEFKNPLSISHALSGIALVQAVFHGGVKSYVKH